MATMTTKRTPIRPPGGKRITPAAIAAYREMQRLEQEDWCDCEQGCEQRNGIVKIAHCEKWNQLDRILRHEMRLPPWEFPTYSKRLTGHGGADEVARYHMLKAAADAADDEAVKKAPA
jgi:hypothetical protein